MFPGDIAPISFEKPCLQTLAPASTLSSQGIPAALVSSSFAANSYWKAAAEVQTLAQRCWSLLSLQSIHFTRIWLKRS